MSIAMSSSCGVQQTIEALSLCQRAREPIEHETPRPCIVLVEPLPDHLENDLVGDELAGIHEAAGLETEWCTGLHSRSQHVAGGNMGDHVMVRQPHALRPFTRPLLS